MNLKKFDIIELDEIEYYVDTVESPGDETMLGLSPITPEPDTIRHRKVSVALLEHRRDRGDEVTIRTGWRAFSRFVAGRTRAYARHIWKYHVLNHDDLDDTCDKCGESVDLSACYSGPGDRPYHEECLADLSTAVKWPDVQSHGEGR